MRIILNFIRQNSPSRRLRLLMRLIGPPGLLIAAAVAFASCGVRSEKPRKEAQRDEALKDQAQRDEAPKRPALIDRNSAQSKKLIASDASNGAFFGDSVAIYGDTAIVRAVSGAVYIFERSKGGADNWGEVKKLTASNGKVLEGSKSVAIYAYTVIVGTGDAAYIFERSKGGANNWDMVKKLTAADIKSYATFGASVAIYKDTAIVGATVGEPDNEKNGLGAAYVFERNKGGANNWGKVKKLTGSDRSKDDVYDEFGDSVAICGDTAIVGAYGNPLWANQKGAAYIFVRNQGGADNWGEIKKLTASDGEEDEFGCSVAIYGDTAIVGGGGDWDTDGGDPGSAYIFERNKGGANNWGWIKKLIPSERAGRDGFGASVAIYADIAIVGARGGRSAYIFERNKSGANNWGEVESLSASGGDGDMFGCSVAIYGNTVIVGASEADNGSDSSQQGAVYIFSPKTLRR